MTSEKRLDIISEAIINFVGEHYGENSDDACYDLEALAEAVEMAIEENEG